MIKKHFYINFFLIKIFFLSIIIYSQSYVDVKNITKDIFQELVQDSLVPVFIMISSQSCPTCKNLEYQLIECLKNEKEQYIVGKIEIHENENFLQKLLQDIFKKHHHLISGFPSILIFFRGEFITSIHGVYNSQEALEEVVNKVLVDIN